MEKIKYELCNSSLKLQTERLNKINRYYVLKFILTEAKKCGRFGFQ